MFVFTLLVIGLLLLAFKSTRLAGVAGLTLLSLIYPLLFLALLITGGTIFYFYQRRHNYVCRFPKLPVRRD